MKKIFFLGVIFLSVLFASCSSKTVFNERHEFQNLKWNNFDPIVFNVNIKNIDIPYNIYLNMRHITQIPYNDMRVLVVIKTPSGSLRSFPYLFKIKNSEGALLGDGMGDIWDIDNLAKRQFFFNETGVHEFTIKNYTQNYDNVGIMSLGLKIEKSKINKTSVE